MMVVPLLHSSSPPPTIRPGPSPDPFPEWHWAIPCLFPPDLPFPLSAIKFSPFSKASLRPLLPAPSLVAEPGRLLPGRS